MPKIILPFVLVVLFAWAITARAQVQEQNVPPAQPAAQGQPAQASQPAQTGQPANPFLADLKNPDPKLRIRAAREIGRERDAGAVPALAEATRDPDARVRQEAVNALALIHLPEGLEALEAAAHDPDQDVRLAAVEALVGYYTGKEPQFGVTGFVKKNVGEAKSRLSGEDLEVDPGLSVDPKVVAAIEDAMADENSDKPAHAAARGLGTLRVHSAVPNLVKTAHSSDTVLAQEAIHSLGKIRDISAGPQLIDLFDSRDKDVKREAMVTAGMLRAHEALPKLQAAYENDSDRKTRDAALGGLAYLGDPSSVPVFVKALWSDNKLYRTLAAEGLARAHDPKTLDEVHRAAVAERDAGVRLAMEFAVTALGNQEFMSEMINTLSSKRRGDDDVVYLLELSRDPNFRPRLYPYLDSPDAEVRKRLCTVLMYTGDQSSIDVLERVSHDRNSDVAAEALRALRAIRVRVSSSSG